MSLPLLICPVCTSDEINVLSEHIELDRDDEGRLLIVRSGDAVCVCGFHSGLLAFMQDD